jgi:ribonuclease T2
MYILVSVYYCSTYGISFDVLMMTIFLDDEDVFIQQKEQDYKKNNRPHMIIIAISLTIFCLMIQTRKDISVQFDLYIMSMSYQPQFCYQNRHEMWPGCTNPQDYWKNHLTIHGMWPEFSNGKWPEYCTHKTLNKHVIEPLLPRLDHYWPNVKATMPNSTNYYDFWQHEWSKHGTCSGLDAKTYFETALRHFVDTPEVISKNYGGTVLKSDILKGYGDDRIILVCQDKQWLSEVRICLSVDKNGHPLQQVACPKAAEDSVSSCEGEHIRISKFPSLPSHVDNSIVA